MKLAMRFRVVLVLATMALVAGAAWACRPRLQAWTRARLAQRLLSEVAAQSEEQAVRLVRELDQDDPEWLVVFVAAFADQRPAVAAAGQAALVDTVERWQGQTAEGYTSRVATLASLLAAQSPRLAPERLVVAQGLAHQLLAWPINSRQADSARLIADCQTILSLPRPELEEIRLAAMPPSIQIEPEQAPAPVSVPTAEITPVQPAPPIEAPRESPDEPRRLAPPKAMRISDD